jgi:DNA-binding Lrp family transcriptional regulator
MEDGRKSFRVVSREIKVSTPTVKSRYERLVNIGLIKSVKPEIDLYKVNRRKKNQFFGEETIKQLEEQKKHFHVKVDNNMKVKMQCEYCGGPIQANPKCLSLLTFRDFSAALAAKTTIRKSVKAGYCP